MEADPHAASSARRWPSTPRSPVPRATAAAARTAARTAAGVMAGRLDPSKRPLPSPMRAAPEPAGGGARVVHGPTAGRVRTFGSVLKRPVLPPPRMFGFNSGYVEDLYAQYLQNPESVSASWRDFFADFNPGPTFTGSLGAAAGDGAGQDDERRAGPRAAARLGGDGAARAPPAPIAPRRPRRLGPALRRSRARLQRRARPAASGRAAAPCPRARP